MEAFRMLQKGQVIFLINFEAKLPQGVSLEFTVLEKWRAEKNAVNKSLTPVAELELETEDKVFI